jgi:hypothetical protein
MIRRTGRVGLLLFSIASNSCGQPEVQVSDESGIILDRVATIRPGEDTGLYGPMGIAFDSQGRMIIAGPDMNDGVPFVTNLEGDVIKSLGHHGEGPGELSDVSAIFVDASDSLFVFDYGTGRMSVFDPELAYARTYQIDSRAAGTGHRFSNGNWLISSARSTGPPFLLIDPDGHLLSAWGDSVDFVLTVNGVDQRFSWLIGPGMNDVAWATRRSGRFEILGFDSDGIEIVRLSPEVEWFSNSERPMMPSADSPPQSSVVSVWEDEAGLWVVGWTTDERWRDALGAEYRVEGQTASRVKDFARYLDMVIELRDPVTGDLRASRREDKALLPSWAGVRDLLLDRTEDEIGFWGFDLYRVRYAEPE